MSIINTDDPSPFKLNLRLFTVDEKPLGFYLLGYDIDEFMRIAKIIEGFGGKLSDPSGSDIIVSGGPNPSSEDYSERFDIRFLYDSIVAQKLQKLEEYRIRPSTDKQLDNVQVENCPESTMKRESMVDDGLDDAEATEASAGKQNEEGSIACNSSVQRAAPKGKENHSIENISNKKNILKVKISRIFSGRKQTKCIFSDNVQQKIDELNEVITVYASGCYGTEVENTNARNIGSVEPSCASSNITKEYRKSKSLPGRKLLGGFRVNHQELNQCDNQLNNEFLENVNGRYEREKSTSRRMKARRKSIPGGWVHEYGPPITVYGVRPEREADT